MAFCNKLMKGIRKVMDQVDEPLGNIIAEITKYTGMVKAGLEIIPDGKIKTFMNTALGELSGVVTAVDSYDDNLKAWLDSATSEDDRDSKVFKLASVGAKAFDADRGEVKRQKVYDTATQARIIADTADKN